MDNYTIHSKNYNEDLIKQAKHITIFYNGMELQQILNAIPENVKSLSLENVILPIIIPEHIEKLSLSRDSLIDKIQFNSKLQTLILESLDTIFQNFPVNIQNLVIYSNSIRKLVVPDNLKKLKLYCISLQLPNLPNLEKLHIYCEYINSIDFLPHSLRYLSLQSYKNTFNLVNIPINLYKLKIHGFAPDLTNLNVKYVKYCDENPINFPLNVEKIKSGGHPQNLAELKKLRILKCNATTEDVLYVPQQLEKLYCCRYDKIVFANGTKIKKIKVKNCGIMLTQFVNLPENVRVCMRKGYQVWRDCLQEK